MQTTTKEERQPNRFANHYVLRSIHPLPTVAASLSVLNAVLQSGGEVLDRADGMFLFAADPKSARKLERNFPDWILCIETSCHYYANRCDI